MPLSNSGAKDEKGGVMVTGFERIIVEVPDLEEAASCYRRLSGLEGTSAVLPGQGEVIWFCFGNTVIQLQDSERDAASVSAIVFSPGDEAALPAKVDNKLGLDLRIADGSDLSLADNLPLPEGDLRVDHLVLRAGDAEACIELFGEQLGIRLALDREAPDWGGRMLFFRTGKLTLEVIASRDTKRSTFWGIAYQCADISATKARLDNAGVSVTQIREGRKPGTLVATIKSHCLGIPTLLIGPST